MLAMHTLTSATFSLPPGVGGLAAASACGSSWTFLFTCFILLYLCDTIINHYFPGSYLLKNQTRLMNSINKDRPWC